MVNQQSQLSRTVSQSKGIRKEWLNWPHWVQPTHICVGSLITISSDNGLASRHYLNQRWNIVNLTLRNKLQGNFDRDSNIFIWKMRLKVSSAKWQPFCRGLNATFKGLLPTFKWYEHPRFVTHYYVIACDRRIKSLIYMQVIFIRSRAGNKD